MGQERTEISKANSFFQLAQLFITLGGFFLLISTVAYLQEKNLAFKGSEEIIRNNRAFNEGGDEYKITIDGRSYFEQSHFLQEWVRKFTIAGILFILLSFLFWSLGFYRIKEISEKREFNKRLLMFSFVAFGVITYTILELNSFVNLPYWARLYYPTVLTIIVLLLFLNILDYTKN